MRDRKETKCENREVMPNNVEAKNCKVKFAGKSLFSLEFMDILY